MLDREGDFNPNEEEGQEGDFTSNIVTPGRGRNTNRPSETRAQAERMGNDGGIVVVPDYRSREKEKDEGQKEAAVFSEEFINAVKKEISGLRERIEELNRAGNDGTPEKLKYLKENNFNEPEADKNIEEMVLQSEARIRELERILKGDQKDTNKYKGEERSPDKDPESPKEPDSEGTAEEGGSESGSGNRNEEPASSSIEAETPARQDGVEASARSERETSPPPPPSSTPPERGETPKRERRESPPPSGDAPSFVTAKLKPVYMTITRLFGAKFGTDLLLALKKEGNIYEYFRGKGEQRDVDEALYALERSAEGRRFSLSRENEKVREERFRSAVKEYKQRIERSHASQEEKKRLMRELGVILSERKRNGKSVEGGRDTRIRSAINRCIDTKTKGIEMARDALDLVLVGAGFGIARGAAYGLSSLAERGVKAHDKYSREQLQATEGMSRESRFRFILRDMTVTAARETFESLSLQRGSTKKEKAINFARAAGTLARAYGIAGATTLAFADEAHASSAIDKLLNSVSKDGIAHTFGENFKENALRVLQVFGIGRGWGDTPEKMHYTDVETSLRISDRLGALSPEEFEKIKDIVEGRIKAGDETLLHEWDLPEKISDMSPDEVARYVIGDSGRAADFIGEKVGEGMDDGKFGIELPEENDPAVISPADKEAGIAGEKVINYITDETKEDVVNTPDVSGSEAAATAASSSEVPAPAVSEAALVPEKIGYQGGRHVWGELEKQFQARDGSKFAAFDEAEKTHAIDYLKDKIAKNPEAYGFPKGADIDVVTKEQLEKINWDKLFEEVKAEDEAAKMVPELSDAAKENIIENNRLLAEYQAKTGAGIDTETADELAKNIRSAGGAEAYIEALREKAAEAQGPKSFKEYWNSISEESQNEGKVAVEDRVDEIFKHRPKKFLGLFNRSRIETEWPIIRNIPAQDFFDDKVNITLPKPDNVTVKNIQEVQSYFSEARKTLGKPFADEKVGGYLARFEIAKKEK